jgi:hypothetical protein
VVVEKERVKGKKGDSIEKLKRTAFEISQYYKCNITIELNVDNSNEIVKLKVTEHIN